MKRKSLIYSMMLCSIYLISPQTFSAPPQNTIDACADEDEGDVCSFTNDLGDSVDGSCQYLSNDETYLVCKLNQ